MPSETFDAATRVGYILDGVGGIAVWFDSITGKYVWQAWKYDGSATYGTGTSIRQAAKDAATALYS